MGYDQYVCACCLGFDRTGKNETLFKVIYALLEKPSETHVFHEAMFQFCILDEE